MTRLELLLTAIIWIMVGLFICFKRNWYKSVLSDEKDTIVFCAFAILFTPVSLAIAIVREMIWDSWNNGNV